jgi:hypothetical protein
MDPMDRRVTDSMVVVHFWILRPKINARVVLPGRMQMPTRLSAYNKEKKEEKIILHAKKNKKESILK